MEEWRDIPGWEGLYRISSIGRVASVGWINRKTKTIALRSPKLRKVQPHKSGYIQVRLLRDAVGKTMKVHRLVLEAFIGKCPDGMECLHADGDKANNRLENLSWGTPVENYQDRKRHGTDNAGERSNTAQITASIVRMLLAEYDGKYGSIVRMARKHNLSYQIVRFVVKRRTWKHIAAKEAI